MGFYMKRNEDRHTERQRVRERVSASVGVLRMFENGSRKVFPRFEPDISTQIFG